MGFSWLVEGLKTRVEPLAFDSMGIRSMATKVVIDEVAITIDPSVSIAPRRYGLPPHPKELRRLEELGRLVEREASRSSLLTISHYHYDHYDPSATFYAGKTLLIKDPKNNINRSQYIRARFFMSRLQEVRPARVEVADGKMFKFDDVTLKFSPPFPHGPRGSKLGYVLMLAVRSGDDVLVHSSDVQGPVVDEAADWIIGENPSLLILCGPPTYFLGWRFSTENLNRAKNNMCRIIERCSNLKTMVLDHHLLRDLRWKGAMAEVFDKAEELGVNLICASQLAGREPEQLEALRKKLWGGEAEE